MHTFASNIFKMIFKKIKCWYYLTIIEECNIYEKIKLLWSLNEDELRRQNLQKRRKTTKLNIKYLFINIRS